MDVSNLEIGANEVTVTYSGDDDHEGSETTTTIDVKKGSPTLEASAEPGEYGQGATVTVTTDPAATGLVYLYNEGALVGQGIIKDGSSEITTFHTELDPGDHTLDVLYNGSSTYDPADTTVDVSIAKATTKPAKTSSSPSNVVKNKTKATLRFQVKAEGYTPTGKVRVQYGTFTKTVTLSGGRGTVVLRAFTSSGFKKVKLTYLGDDLAAPSVGYALMRVYAK